MGSSSSKDLLNAVEAKEYDRLIEILQTSSGDRELVNSTKTDFELVGGGARCCHGQPAELVKNILYTDCNLLHLIIFQCLNDVEDEKNNNSTTLSLAKSALTLCQCGINKNSFTSSSTSGLTPLHLAISLMISSETTDSEIDKRLLGVVKALLMNQDDKTASFQFSLKPEQQEFANSRCDVNLETRNSLQETPLHIACRVGNNYWWKYSTGDAASKQTTPTHEVLIELLANGADISATDFLGRTPLHYACISLLTPPSVVAELLTAIASSPKAESILNAVDKHGLTALHYACFLLQKEKVALLLAQPLIDWELPVGAVYKPNTREIDKDSLQGRMTKLLADQQEEGSDCNAHEPVKVCKLEPFLHLQRVFAFRAFHYSQILGRSPVQLVSTQFFHYFSHDEVLCDPFITTLVKDSKKMDEYVTATAGLFKQKLASASKSFIEKHTSQ